MAERYIVSHHHAPLRLLQTLGSIHTFKGQMRSKWCTEERDGFYAVVDWPAARGLGPVQEALPSLENRCLTGSLPGVGFSAGIHLGSVCSTPERVVLPQLNPSGAASAHRAVGSTNQYQPSLPATRCHVRMATMGGTRIRVERPKQTAAGNQD